MRALSVLVVLLSMFFVSCERASFNFNPGSASDPSKQDDGSGTTPKIKIKHVATSDASSPYDVDDVILIEVIFDGDINVEGVPVIVLDTGDGRLVEAEYVSGSGTSELIFRRVVEVFDRVETLQYRDKDALEEREAKISASKGGDVDLTLPEPGATNSLSGRSPVALQPWAGLPDMKLWVDARDPYGDGTLPKNSTKMEEWVDKSDANGNQVFDDNTVVKTTGQAPKYTDNRTSKTSAIYFDGQKDFLERNFPDYKSDVTIVIVATPHNDSQKKYTSLFNTFNNYKVGPTYDSLQFDFLGNNPGTLRFRTMDDEWIPFGTAETETIVLTGRVKGTEASAMMNGQLYSTGKFTEQVLREFVIGRNRHGTKYFQGELHEVMVFSRALEDTELTHVHSYLINKWM